MLRRLVTPRSQLGPLGLLHAAARTPLSQVPRPHWAIARLSTDAKATADAASAEQPAEPANEAAAKAAAEATAEGAEESTSAEGADVAALEVRIAELDAQLTEKHDQMLRALAEADNARRRAALDVENAHKFGVGKFAKDLLDVADNLSRAADSVPEELRSSDEQPVLKALFDGVKMTDSVLLNIFEKHGLQKLDPLGEKFDPNVHNAMFEAPDPTKEPGTVMHVAAPGYVLHGRCLRAAGVGVVSKPP